MLLNAKGRNLGEAVWLNQAHACSQGAVAPPANKLNIGTGLDFDGVSGKNVCHNLDLVRFAENDNGRTCLYNTLALFQHPKHTAGYGRA